MKSWKTTLIGWIGAAAVIAVDYIAHGSIGGTSIATAVTLAAGGTAAKDSDVGPTTGGTRAQ